jgi:tetratricopeptide (TPR) repeat protein
VSAVLEESLELRTHELTARAQYLRARALQRLSRFTEAEQTLELAILAGERAADPALVARAWSTLIFTVGARGHRFEEALAHEIAARAALSRVEDLAPADVALLESSLAATQGVQGDHAAAVNRLERALRHEAELTPRRRMVLHYDLSLSYTKIGQALEGLEHGQQAEALAGIVHGPEHSSALSMALSGVIALRELDRTTEAVARARQVLATLAMGGDREPTFKLVMARLQLASALIDRGDLPQGDNALDALERDAARIGLASTIRSDLLRLRGHTACGLGRRDEAVVLLQEVLAGQEASDHVPAADELAMVLELARCERDRGELAIAAKWIKTAEAIKFPAERPAPAFFALLEERARIELSTGQTAQDTINVMARLARRIDRPSAGAVLDVLRAHAAATQGAPDTARFHAQAAQRALVGADSRRARLLQAEVDAYLRPIENDTETVDGADQAPPTK